MPNVDTAYPKIATSSWWALRNLFKKTVPSAVTSSYLASALSMSEASAKSNLISPFRKIGIINDDGKPTDLAYEWRDDHKYAQVCTTLIEKNYPPELRDLYSDSSADMGKLIKWFMHSARCGEPAAKMYARFYMLLLVADPNETAVDAQKKDSKSANAASQKKTAKTKASLPAKIEAPVQQSQIAIPAPSTATVLNKSPELHINIQLHISPESTAEQIDKIFESMARHLKDFNK